MNHHYIVETLIFFGSILMYAWIGLVILALIAKLIHMAGVIFTVNPNHLNEAGKREYGFSDLITEDEKRSL